MQPPASTDAGGFLLPRGVSYESHRARATTPLRNFPRKTWETRTFFLG